VGGVLNVLENKLVDAYLHIPDGKELWDALDAKFNVADAGGEPYAMEQFNEDKMVANRSWQMNSSSSSLCYQTSSSRDALSLSFPSRGGILPLL
jgi:hypothetical protein